MAKIESYRDLIVWQQAMDLAVSIYEVTRAWPKDEIYGMTGQVRRAATSVPANIAEVTAERAELPISNFSGSPKDHSRNWRRIL